MYNLNLECSPEFAFVMSLQELIEVLIMVLHYIFEHSTNILWGGQSGEIIVYSQSTINACSFLSHEWWVPLIKFMVEPTIHVRRENTYLWYSGNT